MAVPRDDDFQWEGAVPEDEDEDEEDDEDDEAA